MNNDLKDIILTYALKSHQELSSLLLGKSKDNLIASLTDLLTAYMNDKNSSSLREFITVSEHNAKKLGYNGYKHNSSIGGNRIGCEAKPKNIVTADNENEQTKIKKLNGEGNFSDYTPERLEKDLKEKLNMLSSGFIDVELQYILEYPFKVLKKRLIEQLPKERKKGEYKRSANFNFKHYKDSSDLKIIYINKQAILRNEKYFNKEFFKFLIDSNNE
ncbi:MAG: hypothetical protein ACRC0A_04710 [Chitinophagaceae bacterium]